MSAAETNNTTLPPSAPIRRRLAGARRLLVGLEFGKRLLITLAVIIAVTAGLLISDALFELPLGVRRVALWGAIIIAGGFLLWTLAALVTARRRDEEIALLVERDNPRLDSRLIGAVQFAEGHATVPAGAPTEMAKAAVVEAEDESKRANFLGIADPRSFARAALLFLALLIGGGVLAFAKRDTLSALIARALGDDTPLPRETRIVGAAGGALIGIGDRIELAFTAEGVLPAQGELDIRYESGRREKSPLLPDESTPGRYLAAIDDVPETFTFRAEINDASTEPATITALERPAVVTLSATQTYPAFTGLEPTEHTPGGFALLPGSELAFTLIANKPLASAQLTFVGTGEDLPLEIAGERCTASFTVPPETLGGFTVALVDDKGLESKDNTVYRVTQLVDRPPEIRITFPRRAEELVTRRARVLLRYTASDRFGIVGINLRYRRGEEPGSLSVEIPERNPKAIEGELEWDISKLTPPATEGETIEYWFEATDQNGSDDEDRIGRTERLRVKVVTAEEKRADLLGRASDTLGGVSEATDDQQRLNEALERLIRDAASDAKP